MSLCPFPQPRPPATLHASRICDRHRNTSARLRALESLQAPPAARPHYFRHSVPPVAPQVVLTSCPHPRRSRSASQPSPAPPCRCYAPPACADAGSAQSPAHSRSSPVATDAHDREKSPRPSSGSSAPPPQPRAPDPCRPASSRPCLRRCSHRCCPPHSVRSRPPPSMSPSRRRVPTRPPTVATRPPSPRSAPVRRRPRGDSSSNAATRLSPHTSLCRPSRATVVVTARRAWSPSAQTALHAHQVRPTAHRQCPPLRLHLACFRRPRLLAPSLPCFLAPCRGPQRAVFAGWGGLLPCSLFGRFSDPRSLIPGPCLLQTRPPAGRQSRSAVSLSPSSVQSPHVPRRSPRAAPNPRRRSPSLHQRSSFGALPPHCRAGSRSQSSLHPSRASSPFPTVPCPLPPPAESRCPPPVSATSGSRAARPFPHLGPRLCRSSLRFSSPRRAPGARSSVRPSLRTPPPRSATFHASSHASCAPGSRSPSSRRPPCAPGAARCARQSPSTLWARPRSLRSRS